MSPGLADGGSNEKGGWIVAPSDGPGLADGDGDGDGDGTTVQADSRKPAATAAALIRPNRRSAMANQCVLERNRRHRMGAGREWA